MWVKSYKLLSFWCPNELILQQKRNLINSAASSTAGQILFDHHKKLIWLANYDVETEYTKKYNLLKGNKLNSERYINNQITMTDFSAASIFKNTSQT